MHHSVYNSSSRRTHHRYPRGLSLQDDSRQSFAMAWQDHNIGRRIVNRSVPHWPGENHPWMRLQTFPSFCGKRVLVLKTSHQEQPLIWEFLIEFQESFRQLSNAFVDGETPDECHDICSRGNS